MVISDSVTSIGDGAFQKCRSLNYVTIGKSVSTIGERAFYYCDRLQDIEVSETNANYCDIDGNLYSKEGTILIQYALGKMEQSFTMPNSVTNISSLAFAGCNNIKKVYYCGNEEEWGNVSIGSGNEDLTWWATTYFYSATEPTEDGNYWHYVDGEATVW